PKFMESNVWSLFEGRIFDKQGVIRGKEESNKEITDYREAVDFDDILSSRSNVLLITQSCIDALRKFPKESIDYVFTDPPYGGSIQYSELTFMWSSWLGFDSDFSDRAKDEIIINRSQKKGFDEYYNMIFSAFTEIYNVMKKGSYMTLTFHNPDIKIRNAIIRAGVFAGLDFQKIIFQEPPRPSAKGLLQPFGSLQGDYFLRFRKPMSQASNITQEEISKERYEEIITEISERIIAERGAPTHFTYIQNAIDPILYSELKTHGLLLQHKPENVENVLKQQIGKRFVLLDAPIGTLKGKAWWLKDPSSLHIDIIPLNKRVEETIINLLKRKFKASFTEILTEIFTQYRNSLTPDKESVMSILSHVAEKTTNDQWTLKPSTENILKRHEEMVLYLAKIGLKAKFNVHLANDEYGKKFEGKFLRELIPVEELKLDTGIPDWNLRRIGRIDVIWFKNKKVYYSFDVENSTNITDSLMRASNIPEDSLVKRRIVIPSEYETLMNRVFNEPAVNEIVEKQRWRILTFEHLTAFYNKVKYQDEVDLDDFEIIARVPREHIKKQTKLSEF
ncbi:MAG: hypothetical protein JRN15_08180, partial [Nitrososphaerota archaeon]|nr:hypothetical protein [Nitrososphaerota archaeon]